MFAVILAFALVQPAFAQDTPLPAPAPTPAPAPAPAPAPKVARDRAYGAVGIHVGPSIGLTGLGIGVLPRLDLGAVVSKKRIHVFATGAWTRPTRKGTETDLRIGDGSYDWKMANNQILLGAGFAVRPGKSRARLRPELGLAGQLCVLGTRSEATSGDATFPTTTETSLTGGGMADVGLIVAAGPGELAVRAEVSLMPFRGLLTGKTLAVTLAPTVGYRFLF